MRAATEADKVRMRAYYRENHQRIREQNRAYAAAHREEALAYAKEYHAANREKALADRKAWYLANREQQIERSRAWYAANPELVAERRRKWKAANPQKINDASARRRARLRSAPEVEIVDRNAIIARDRSRCHLCRKRVAKQDLVLDHILPLAEGGSHTAANLAVAHALCNLRKGTRAANDQLRMIG